MYGASPSGQSEHARPLCLSDLAPNVILAGLQHASRARGARAPVTELQPLGPESVEPEAPSREPEDRRLTGRVQCVPFAPKGSVGLVRPSRVWSSRVSDWELGVARARVELALPRRGAEGRL